MKESTKGNRQSLSSQIIYRPAENNRKANPIVRIRSQSPQTANLMSPVNLRASFGDSESTDEELTCTAVLDQSTRSIELNKYEWGDVIRKDGERVYFDSLKVYGSKEETIVRINDHVLIENQDNPSNPFVARVEQFYDNSTRKNDSKRAIVSWFLRSSECQDMKPTLKVAGKVDDEIMLFSASTIPKNVDAEVIIWKCEVYSFEFYNQLQTSNRPITDRRFFCRSHFNGSKIINFKPHDRPYKMFNRPPRSVSPKKTKNLENEFARSDFDVRFGK